MTDFLQLHLLIAFGPSNLNRDDTGRPKSVIFGGVNRIRVSSQSLKRAWRTSDVFKDALEGHLADRTRRLGRVVHKHLLELGASAEDALNIARDVAMVFGEVPAPKSDLADSVDSTDAKQLAFISQEERAAALARSEEALRGKPIEKTKKGKKVAHEEHEAILRQHDGAADVAMFGRMLADARKFNREASVQVAHAFTTHQAHAEDDYYTAVDDLKSQDELDDAGAGFISVQEFSAGVFYVYICVDRDLLLKNVGGERPVRDAAVAALVEAAATVAPRGKQASFASRARAFYILAERGPAQPRSLAGRILEAH